MRQGWMQGWGTSCGKIGAMPRRGVVKVAPARGWLRAARAPLCVTVGVADSVHVKFGDVHPRRYDCVHHPDRGVVGDEVQIVLGDAEHLRGERLRGDAVDYPPHAVVSLQKKLAKQTDA